MRAVSYTDFGPPGVLSVGEVEAPTLQPGQMRVQVVACALNPKDVLERKGKFGPLIKVPRIPGYDFSGRVAAVGDAVSAFRGFPIGTPVFGMIPGFRGGACADTVCIEPGHLAALPDNLDLVAAAGVPLAGSTALQALDTLAHLRGGQRVLINGASGGVGTFAVQLARAMDVECIAVCSEKNRSFVEQLGATEVLPYDTHPLEQETVGPDRQVDAAVDLFGTLPYARAKPWLKEDGLYVTAIPTAKTLLREGVAQLRVHSKRRLVVVQSRRRDLEKLADLLEDDRIQPIVDQVLPLDDAAEAHRYLETKRAKGKVVLQISDDRAIAS